MAGFGDRLASMKKAQEDAEKKKQEQAAAESAAREREAKLDELSKRREAVGAEMAQAELEAGEAKNAVAEAEAFANEQGENLDPAAKAEIDGTIAEAGIVVQKFESLKQEIAQVDAEIASLQGEESENDADEREANLTSEEKSAELPPISEDVQKRFTMMVSNFDLPPGSFDHDLSPTLVLNEAVGSAFGKKGGGVYC